MLLHSIIGTCAIFVPKYAASSYDLFREGVVQVYMCISHPSSAGASSLILQSKLSNQCRHADGTSLVITIGCDKFAFMRPKHICSALSLALHLRLRVVSSSVRYSEAVQSNFKPQADREILPSFM